MGKCRDCGRAKDDPDQTYCECQVCHDCERVKCICKGLCSECGDNLEKYEEGMCQECARKLK